MKTMRVAIAREAGPPQSIELDRLPVPDLAPGRVLVAVKAASVNPVDIKMMSGTMGTPFPLVPGRDLAGTVIEVGGGVEGLEEGDAVFGSAVWGPAGAFADMVVCDPASLAKIPALLSDEMAAALPTIVFTAHEGLFDRGEIGSGNRVLITGASGGVGGMAVQLAKRAGAYVVGTASTRNRAYVLSLGADEFLAYDEDPEYAGVRDIDLVFDLVGGETTTRAGHTLASGGRLISTANFELPALPNGIPVETYSARPNPAALREVGELVASGELKVEIETVYAFEEIPKALIRSATGRVRGKLIVSLA